MGMRPWALVAIGGAACVSACGLGTAGLGPPDREAGASSSGSGSGSGPGDAASEGSASGGSSGSASGSGSGSASSSSGAGEAGPALACVSGWTLVLGEMGSAACPAGYPAAYQGVANAQAGSGACTCSCTITTQPNCTTGNVTWSWGTQPPSCPNPSPYNSNGMCQPIFGNPMLGSAQDVQPIPFSGGVCSGQAVGDTSKVQQTPAHTCTVPDANAAAVCAGSVPGGFAACIIAPGDVQCPSGSPFSTRTVIADSETLVCSDCASCMVTGSCKNPVLNVYSDAQCMNVVAAIPADGTCTSEQSKAVGSYWYQATVMAQCAASGTSASLQAHNPQTLCCR